MRQSLREVYREVSKGGGQFDSVERQTTVQTFMRTLVSLSISSRWFTPPFNSTVKRCIYIYRYSITLTALSYCCSKHNGISGSRRELYDVYRILFRQSHIITCMCINVGRDETKPLPVNQSLIALQLDFTIALRQIISLPCERRVTFYVYLSFNFISHYCFVTVYCKFFNYFIFLFDFIIYFYKIMFNKNLL